MKQNSIFKCNFYFILNFFILTEIRSLGVFSVLNIAKNNYNFTSVHVENSHLVALMQTKTGTLNYGYTFFLPSDTYANATVPTWSDGKSNFTAKIRTGAFNSFYPYPSTYLLFNDTHLQVVRNLETPKNIYNATGVGTVLIKQVCFGNTQNQIFIFQIQNATGMKFITLTLLNITKIIKTSIGISTSSRLKYMKFDNNRIFIYATYSLVVYNTINNTINLYWTLPHNANQTGYMDMKIYDDIILITVAYDNTINKYNITSKQKLSSYNGIPFTYCFAKLSGYLVVFASNITIINFTNFSYAGQSTYTSNSPFYLCDTLIYNTKQVIVIYDRDPYPILQFFSLDSTKIIPSYVTYVNNITTPINTTNIININNITITDVTSINNTINNNTFPIIIDVVNTNTTINYTNINNINNTNTIEKKYSTLDYACKYFANTLIFSSMRISPKFLLSFLFFLDDLWLYKFHRKFQPQYPNTTKAFMEKIDLIKDIQTSINFMSNFNFIPIDQTQLIQKNTKKINYLQFTSHDSKNIFFLYSIDDIYMNAIPFNIIFYIILKLFQLLIFKLKQKLKKFQSFYNSFKSQTRWWTVLVSIIQANIVVLLYSVSLQFYSNSYDDLLQKINYIVCSLVFFACIIYILVFYPLIFYLDHKKAAKSLLIRCKYNRTSFWYESYMFISRSSLKSFFHGFLITNYRMQIVILFLLDIPFIILIIKMRKCFQYKIFFIIMLLYLIGFAIFNLYFVLENIHIIRQIQSDRQFFGLIISSVLAILSVILALSFLFIAVYEIFLSIKQRFIGKNKLTLKQKQKNNCMAQIQSNPKCTDVNKRVNKIYCSRNFNLSNKPKTVKMTMKIKQNKAQQYVNRKLTSNKKQNVKAIDNTTKLGQKLLKINTCQR